MSIALYTSGIVVARRMGGKIVIPPINNLLKLPVKNNQTDCLFIDVF